MIKRKINNLDYKQLKIAVYDTVKALFNRNNGNSLPYAKTNDDNDFDLQLFIDRLKLKSVDDYRNFMCKIADSGFFNYARLSKKENEFFEYTKFNSADFSDKTIKSLIVAGYITIFIVIGIIPFFIGYLMNLSRIRKIQNISNQLKKEFFL